MNNENNRLNKLKEKILNLKTGINLIEKRLTAAHNSIDPNSRNLRDQASIRKFIKDTENSLQERRIDLEQLKIKYNSEYELQLKNLNQSLNSFDVKMESDKEKSDNTTSNTTDNTNKNNNMASSQTGDETATGGNTKIVDQRPGEPPLVITGATPSTQPVTSITGTFKKTTIDDKSTYEKNKLELPKLKPINEGQIDQNKFEKRLGPFNEFLEKQKNKSDSVMKSTTVEAPFINQGTPIKYADFSENLIFGKSKNWVPNNSFEYRSNKVELEDVEPYKRLYDENQRPIRNDNIPHYPTTGMNEQSKPKEMHQFSSEENQTTHPKARDSFLINQNRLMRPKTQDDSFDYQSNRTVKFTDEVEYFPKNIGKPFETTPTKQILPAREIYKESEAPRQIFNHEIPEISYEYENNRNQNTSLENRAKPPTARPTFIKRLAAIPELEGDTFENLKKFIEKVDTLYYSTVNEVEINELYEQMILKINGEVRNLIINLENLNWENVKTKLYDHFSHLCNKSLLTTQLENLKQGKNESIAEYSERARKLLNKKNAMYSKLTEDQKIEHNRVAYKAFTRGLKDIALKERASTRGASSLEDAIECALDMENDTLHQIPRTDLFCRTCKVSGHRELECRRKANSEDPMFNLISAFTDAQLAINRRNNMPPMQRFMTRRMNDNQPRNFNVDRSMMNRNDNFMNPYNYDNQRNRFRNNPYPNQFGGFPNPPNNDGIQNQNRNQFNNQNQPDNRNMNQYNNQNYPQNTQSNPNRNNNNNNTRRNTNTTNNVAINQQSTKTQNSEN